MEPNPYESPKGPTANVVKRGLGVVAIICLTPVAVAIAFGGSCTAVSTYVNATLPGMEGDISSAEFFAWVVSAWAVFLLPPVATLAVMVWWAVRVHRRSLSKTGPAISRDELGP